MIRGPAGLNPITRNFTDRRPGSGSRRGQRRLSALIFSSATLRRHAIAQERRARHLSASIDGERAAPNAARFVASERFGHFPFRKGFPQ
ncbi:hypothetical protein CDS [Bradyrhizobium sp.]|nr:hypothetical protein CDS [Bradyrhizobium sp.]